MPASISDELPSLPLVLREPMGTATPSYATRAAASMLTSREESACKGRVKWACSNP